MSDKEANRPADAAEVEFISELDLSFHPDLTKIHELLESRLTKENLEISSGTNFQPHDIAKIRQSATNFLLSAFIFIRLSDHKSFNNRMNTLSHTSRALLSLLEPLQDDAVGNMALELLYPSPQDRNRLSILISQLNHLVPRAEQIQQEAPVGRPKRHGPELDLLLSELRPLWEKAGGTGIGAYSSEMSNRGAGHFLGLLRLVIDATYDVLRKLSSGSETFTTPSDSYLISAIRKHYSGSDPRVKNPT